MAGDIGRQPQGSKLTYDDYLSLPDDNRRYEILDGELAVTPSPLLRHQRISGRLFKALSNWTDANDLGEVFTAPVDVILDETTVVVPDIVYVSKAGASILTERAVEGPPDLVVEILSPGTRRRDRGVKMKLYARYGVDHYWIVDTGERTIETYECRGDAYTPTGTHSGDARMKCACPPGLEIALGEIWMD